MIPETHLWSVEALSLLFTEGAETHLALTVLLSSFLSLLEASAQFVTWRLLEQMPLVSSALILRFGEELMRILVIANSVKGVFLKIEKIRVIAAVSALFVR